MSYLLSLFKIKCDVLGLLYTVLLIWVAMLFRHWESCDHRAGADFSLMHTLMHTWGWIFLKLTKLMDLFKVLDLLNNVFKWSKETLWWPNQHTREQMRYIKAKEEVIAVSKKDWIIWLPIKLLLGIAFKYTKMMFLIN